MKKRFLFFGLMALLIGLAWTIIGLIGSFNAIEAAGDISPSLVADRIKVSFMPLICGSIVFILSIVLSIYKKKIRNNSINERYQEWTLKK